MKYSILLAPVFALLLTGCFQVQVDEYIDPNGSSIGVLSYSTDESLNEALKDVFCSKMREDIPYDGAYFIGCDGDENSSSAKIETPQKNYEVSYNNNGTITYKIEKDHNYITKKALADLLPGNEDYLLREDELKAQGVSVIQNLKFSGKILSHSTGTRENNNVLSIDLLDGNTVFPIVVTTDVNPFKFEREGPVARVNNVVLARSRNSITRQVRPSYMPRIHSNSGWYSSADK